MVCQRVSQLFLRGLADGQHPDNWCGWCAVNPVRAMLHGKAQEAEWEAKISSELPLSATWPCLYIDGDLTASTTANCADMGRPCTQGWSGFDPQASPKNPKMLLLLLLQGRQDDLQQACSKNDWWSMSATWLLMLMLLDGPKSICRNNVGHDVWQNARSLGNTSSTCSQAADSRCCLFTRIYESREPGELHISTAALL